jgi:hypothetical protein
MKRTLFCILLISALAACGGDEKDSNKGPYTVGIIAPYVPLDDVTNGFQDALAQYAEGENITYAFTRARMAISTACCPPIRTSSSALRPGM